MNGQLQIELFPTNPTCIWLEEWHEHPFCYLWQTFRLEGCGLLHGFPCKVKEKTRRKHD